MTDNKQTAHFNNEYFLTTPTTTSLSTSSHIHFGLNLWWFEQKFLSLQSSNN